MYKLGIEGNSAIPVDNMIWAIEDSPECKYPKPPQCKVIYTFPDFFSSKFISINKKKNIVVFIV